MEGCSEMGFNWGRRRSGDGWRYLDELLVPVMFFPRALDVLRSESMISRGQCLQFYQSLESYHYKNGFLSTSFPAIEKRSPLGQDLQL